MADSEIYSSPTLVDGFGDEIVYGFAVLVGVLLLTVSFLYSNSNNGQQRHGIHPDSATAVAQARVELQEQSGRTTEGQGSGARLRHGNRDTTCPICLADICYCVETNCGHCFCGQCMVTFWQHISLLTSFKCPVCRQLVTIIFFNFTNEEVADTSDEKRDIMDKIRSYNRRFSGEPRPLLDYIRDLPTLLRHFITEIFSPGGFVWMFRLRVVVLFLAAILYFISPLDIIPEAVFGLLGFLDDIFILLLLTIYVTIIYRQVVAARE